MPNSPDSTFTAEVEAACKYYDDAARLGKLQIAEQAWRATLPLDAAYTPELSAPALRAAIDAALQTMRPADAAGRDSRDGFVYFCLYLLIYKRDPYRTSGSITNLNSYLETCEFPRISRSSYHTIYKPEGFKRLAVALGHAFAVHMPLFEAAPTPALFVGRARELQTYGDRLKPQGAALLWGVSGVGKTALAARLAVGAPGPVCWLTLYAGLNTSQNAILHAWAAFLAQHGAPRLWTLLRSASAEAQRPPELLPVLQAGLAQVQPLLCLDNLEVVADADKAVWDLLTFVQARTAGRVLLVASRRPPLPDCADVPPLTGLTPADAAALLHARGLHLPDARLRALIAYTAGNPRLLELGAAYLRGVQTPEGEPALTHFTTSASAEHFLATELLAALSASERRAATLLAFSQTGLAFPLPAGLPLDEIGATPADFDALARRGLLESQGDRRYLSPVLSDYLQAQPRPADDFQAADFHYCLAEACVAQGDPLAAADHYRRADMADFAVEKLADAHRPLLAQGKAQEMVTLLAAIPADKVTGASRRLWRDLKVELWRWVGQYTEAEVEARAADAEAVAPPERAHAGRLLGMLSLARGQGTAAVEHYRRAEQLLDAQRLGEELWLHRDLAWALTQADDLRAAEVETQRAEMALENTRAVIARHRGAWESALAHLARAIALAEDLQELRQLVRATNNRAAIYRQLGRYAEAIADYTQNLTTIEQTGEMIAEAITRLNLGICYTMQEQPAQAIPFQTAALALFEQLADTRGCFLAHLNLAEAQLGVGDLSAAQHHAEAGLAQSQGVSPVDRAECERIYAEVLLGKKECEGARAALERAVTLLYPDGLFRSPLDAEAAQWVQVTQAKIRGECAS